MSQSVDRIGQRALHLVEKLGLVVIVLATIVAIWQEIVIMVGNATVSLADLLLLFIYLEVLTMAGIYLQTGKLPVRLPLYIAIVALARYIVLDVKSMTSFELLAVSGGILILALAILAIRYGHVTFPYEDDAFEETPPQS